MRVTQIKHVEKLPNHSPKKFQFMSDRELVKHMVFRVDSTWSPLSEVSFTVEALSEHIYPSLYVKVLNFNAEPEDVEALDYPTMVDFDHAYGRDPIALLNVRKSVYELDVESTRAYTYLTLAVYQNTYGMTDRRKPEFKLTVSSVEVVRPVTPVVAQPHLAVALAPDAGAAQQASLIREEIDADAFLQF